MATPGKPTKKETKRSIPAKTSFTSPFTLQWSPLPQEDMHFILKTLKDKLVSTGLEKKEVKVFRPWKKKKKQKPESGVKVHAPQQQVQNGWTDVLVRRQLTIGINEATKALERNELKLLLVCKSVKPKHMTQHLISLSAARGVPACQVPQLSQSVSQPLGLKSVLALGFRRCVDSVFTDTVEAIAPKVPALDVAWLTAAEDSVEKEDGEDGQTRGQKRKLECDSEPESGSSCTLQPLKVKRIVANPAKKRKPKQKK